MSSKKRVTERANELGVEIDYEDGELHLDAPEGYVFSATLTHSTAYERGYYQNIPMSKVWPLALDDMSMGVEPCLNDRCEVCGWEVTA